MSGAQMPKREGRGVALKGDDAGLVQRDIDKLFRAFTLFSQNHYDINVTVSGVTITDHHARHEDDGADALTSVVFKSLYDAQTILAATLDDTPAALTVNQQALVGRITGGNIASLTVAQVHTLLFGTAINENVSLAGGKILSVDHIAEKTGAHTVTFDSSITLASGVDILAGATTCDLGTYAAPLGTVTSSGLQVRFADGGGGAAYFDAYSSVNAWDCPYFYFRRFRGTYAGGAAAVAANDILGRVYFSGRGATTYQAAGYIEGVAVEGFTDATSRGVLNICVTPTGSVTPVTVFSVYDSAIYLASGKHLLSFFAANTSDVGDATYYFRAGYFGTLYVNHIAELTGAHSVTFDNDLIVAGRSIWAGGTGYAGRSWSRFAEVNCDLINIWSDGSTSQVYQRCASSSSWLGCWLIAERAKNTLGTPQAIDSGYQIFDMLGRGHTGTAYRDSGEFALYAAENFVEATAYGSEWRIRTVSVGTTTMVTRLTLSSAGAVFADNVYISNTKNLLPGTAGGSDLGSASYYFGKAYATTHYADHIAELTGSHNIVMDNRVMVPAGTEAAPGFACASYTNTGFYWTATPTLYFTIAGAATFAFAANTAYLFGTAADSTSVLFRIQNAQAAAANVGGGVQFVGTATQNTMGRVRCLWEAAANTESAILFDTRLAGTPAERWRITSGGYLRANQDGAAATPVLSWTSDPDSGLYRAGDNSVGIAAGGGLIASIGTGGLTITDAKNIILDTTTGTKIGTATGQKLGFWNAAPVIQQASGDQAAVSLDVDVTGGDTVDKAAINSNFTAIQTLLNRLRADLVTIGAIKGAA